MNSSECMQEKINIPIVSSDNEPYPMLQSKSYESKINMQHIQIDKQNFKVLWVRGMKHSCEEAMNQEFKKYREKVEVKECPSCHNGIEKNEGWNHITCVKCPTIQNVQFKKRGRYRFYYERFYSILLILMLPPLIMLGFILAIPVALISLLGFAVLLSFLLYRQKFHPKCNLRDIKILFLLIFF